MTRQQPESRVWPGPKSPDDRFAVVDLLDAATYHQLALKAAGRSPQTLKRYLTYQRRFLQYLDARHIPPTLDALNPVNVRQAVLWFQQRAVGSRGGEIAVATFLRDLKTWSNFLEAEGVYADSPLRRVKQVRTRSLERQPYTRQEVNAMLEASAHSRMPERDRFLVLLLLDTGARIAEATGLHVGDVRLDLRTIRVLGKGNRERTIPIGDPSLPDGGPLFRALRAWLKKRETMTARYPERADTRLFLTPAGYPLTAEGGTDAIKRLGTAAGVDGAVPHRFRHTAATQYLVVFPGDETGLRRLLGHVSRDTMACYTHLAQSVVAERAGRVSLSRSFLREA